MMRCLHLAALLLLPLPAAAQLELQLVDATGARTAPSLYNLGSAKQEDPLSSNFRIRNSAAGAAVVSAISVAGVGFSVNTPALPAKLDPGGALDFTVEFRSAELGSYSAVLRVENLSIVLTATVQPSLSYRVGTSPLGAIVDFGRVQRGAFARQHFTIVNQAPLILIVPAISIAGAGFVLPATPPSGTTLAPLQSAAFDVDFAPTASGTHVAILILGGRTVLLTGIGTDPPLPRPSLSVDLKQTASAQQGSLIIAFDPPAPSGGSGAAVLEFRGSADASVAFAAGGREVQFPVSPGDTRIALPFQTGTTAGTLVFNVQVGDKTEALSIQIPVSPPVMTQVSGSRAGSTIETRISGWDNTHSVSQMTFTFYDSGGAIIAPGAMRVDVAREFGRYFAASDAGGSFEVRASFAVTGDATQVASFEVTMTDIVGAAKAVRAPLK